MQWSKKNNVSLKCSGVEVKGTLNGNTHISQSYSYEFENVVTIHLCKYKKDFHMKSGIRNKLYQSFKMAVYPHYFCNYKGPVESCLLRGQILHFPGYTTCEN